MIGPVCSLHPGGGGWEPEGAAGRGRSVFAGAVLALSVLGLLTVLAWLGHLMAQQGAADLAGASEPGAPGLAEHEAQRSGLPGSGDSGPSASVQFGGTEPLETTVDHPGGLMLVRVMHRGDGPFALQVTGEAGAADGLLRMPLVDVTGPYQGSRAFGLPEGTYSYRVGVPSGGEWGLAVEQPRYAARLRLPGTLHGVGDTATRPFEVTTERSVRMSWTVERSAGVPADGARLHVRVLEVDGEVVAELAVGDGEEVEHHLAAGRYLLDVSTEAGVWRVLLS